MTAMDGKGREAVRIPVASQPKDRYYEMSIRFTGDVAFTGVGQTLREMGAEEIVPLAKDAGTLRITQCVPFIPDDGTLARYAAILEEGQKKSDALVSISNIRFAGYDYIYAVDAGKSDAAEKEDGA